MKSEPAVSLFVATFGLLVSEVCWRFVLLLKPGPEDVFEAGHLSCRKTFKRLMVKIHGVKSHMQVLVEHTHTVTAVRTMMVKMQMFVCVYYDNKNGHEWYASYCTTALPTELR